MPDLPAGMERALTMTASLLVTEGFNEGKSAANDPAAFPFARINEVLDDRLCPLCAAVNGLVVEVGSAEYREWRLPSHTACRRVMSYVGKDSPSARTTFSRPPADLIATHGHYHLQPPPPGEPRLPGEPAGRPVVVRKIRNPATGEVRTRLDWAPWLRTLPKEKKALILQVRAEPDETRAQELLGKLGITDPRDPEQQQLAALLGVLDRVRGWVDQVAGGAV